MRLAIIIYLVIIKSDYISIIIFYGAIGIIFAVVFQCFLIQAIPSMIGLFFSSEGDEFNSIEEAKLKAGNYINKPVVIKPKSTNFGIGINIFPNGANLEDIVHAFEIAFKNDNTVFKRPVFFLFFL